MGTELITASWRQSCLLGGAHALKVSALATGRRCGAARCEPGNNSDSSVNNPLCPGLATILLDAGKVKPHIKAEASQMCRLIGWLFMDRVGVSCAVAPVRADGQPLVSFGLKTTSRAFLLFGSCCGRWILTCIDTPCMRSHCFQDTANCGEQRCTLL